nr:HNH endonuclease [Mammaliicoccus sp. Marseille-Q6498]
MRKERTGKTIYMYEPLYNKLTPTTYKEIAGWLGVGNDTAKSYGAKKLYHHKIQAYILKDKPTVTDKKKMIFDMKYDDEQWRKTPYENIEISSKGRVRNISREGYKSIVMIKKNKRDISFFYENKRVNIRRLMYETFIGSIPNGYVVTSKSSVREDISPENLKLMKLKEIMIKKSISAVSKPVVFLDERGNFIDEYKNVVTASEDTFYDKNTIGRVCNGQIKVPRTVGYANAFMWADEYYEKVGVC